MAHYQRDVMMWDMDIAAVRDVDRSIAAVPSYDLGYFEIYRSQAAADTLLVGGSGSLFCVSRYLQTTGDLRISDFGATPGCRFEDYVEVAATAAEKQGMRKPARRASARESARIAKTVLAVWWAHKDSNLGPAD